MKNKSLWFSKPHALVHLLIYSAASLCLLNRNSYAQYGYTTLSVPGAYSTVATAVDGQSVVGNFYPTQQDRQGGYTVGFLYNGGTYTTIDVPGSQYTQVLGISGNTLVGDYLSGNLLHGFIYSGANYTTFDVPGYSETTLAGISGNNLGGTVWNGSTVQAFLYNGSSYTFLDLSTHSPVSFTTYGLGLSGNSLVGAYTIPSSATGRGYAVQGFLYENGSVSPVDVPGSVDTEATGISGNLIVGWYDNQTANGVGPNHGFIYNGTTYTTVDVPGSAKTSIAGISGNEFVGEYTDASGDELGFLATPVPESTLFGAMGGVFCAISYLVGRGEPTESRFRRGMLTRFC